MANHLTFLRLLILPVVALGSCSPPLTAAEYRAYLNDPAHGLTREQNQNGTTVICSYRPTPLLVLQEIAGKDVSPAVQDSVAATYEGKTYCTITLSRNGAEFETQFVSTPLFYQQFLAYLNTGIAADAYLVTTSQDSVSAIASMYLRQYGTTGNSTILLVFDTKKRSIESGFHLTLLAQRLGLGTLKFNFSARDLAAL
ncbi:MAG: hypothetical protein M3Y54_07310, partial [Bacteroidota bacterium]|nr:hypothetical protein [Bacteroidota bacterium]